MIDIHSIKNREITESAISIFDFLDLFLMLAPVLLGYRSRYAQRIPFIE